jgi:hypothetical protein
MGDAHYRHSLVKDRFLTSVRLLLPIPRSNILNIHVEYFQDGWAVLDLV